MNCFFNSWTMKSLVFVYFLAVTWTWVQSSPAPFRLCDPSVKSQNSRDIQVDVSDCDNRIPPIPPETSPETCPLVKGTTHNFTIRFVPTITTNVNLERAIIGSFATDKPNAPAEIPYGGFVNAGLSTRKESSGELVKDVGLESGSKYVHNNLFPVVPNAPQTSLIVRYIIREKLTGAANKRANWKVHKGDVIICLEIPVTLVNNPEASTSRE